MTEEQGMQVIVALKNIGFSVSILAVVTALGSLSAAFRRR